MSRRASTFKLHAFKLFKAGIPLREIAEKVGCSRSLVYRWSKQEKWASPLQSSQAPIEAVAKKVGTADNSWVNELLQAKLVDRLAELEAACNKGNVAAIALWIKLTGTQPPKYGGTEPSDAQMPTLVVDLQVKNGRPPVVVAEKIIALPETSAEPGLLNDLRVSGEEAEAVAEPQALEKSLAS